MTGIQKMDYFESIVKTLLDNEGYWTRQSYKVDVTKEEKRLIGKPTIPRPEVDLIAYKPSTEEILIIEVKSYLDSTGVNLSHLREKHNTPEGRFKLFTCENYRNIVFHRLTQDLLSDGLIPHELPVRLGLVAGNVHKNSEQEMKSHFDDLNMFFWGPSDVKAKIESLAKKGYENEPTIIAAKVLLRDN